MLIRGSNGERMEVPMPVSWSDWMDSDGDLWQHEIAIEVGTSAHVWTVATQKERREPSYTVGGELDPNFAMRWQAGAGQTVTDDDSEVRERGAFAKIWVNGELGGQLDFSSPVRIVDVRIGCSTSRVAKERDDQAEKVERAEWRINSAAVARLARQCSPHLNRAVVADTNGE